MISFDAAGRVPEAKTVRDEAAIPVETLTKERLMLPATRVALAMLLISGGACQPRPRETAMSESGPTAAAGATAGLSDQDQASVRAVDAEWAKAATAGNGDALAALYAPDATLLPPGEPMVKGGDAVKKYLGDLTKTYSGTAELNTISVEGNGDLAIAVGTYRMSLKPRKAGAKPLPTEEGKYIEVMKRQDDGSWKIVHDIWNPDAPPKKQ